ncbi:hypothetical protein QHF83_50120, partial [Polyangium sp. 15x6]|nr:hypothetical protein [Polyangium sp. 15x6]
MHLFLSVVRWASSLHRAGASRIGVVVLLILGLVLPASPALGQECKRKTPIRYIGICAHPHGPAYNEWTYDFDGNPVFGPAARQLVACHDLTPLFVFDPRADLKNRGLMPITFHGNVASCEPPPPPKPKPAPPPAPAKKSAPPPKELSIGLIWEAPRRGAAPGPAGAVRPSTRTRASPGLGMEELRGA